MFVQYLSPLIIFVSLSLLAIAFPRVGGFAHALIGLLLALLLFDLNDRVAMLFVIIPMLSLACSIGRSPTASPRGWIIAGLPTLILIICGVEPTMSRRRA